MDRHFRSQLDGSLLSSFEESLLEIDEEEDKTDFCEPFFAAAAVEDSASVSVAAVASSASTTSSSTEFPSSTSSGTSFLSLRRQENIGWIYAKLVESRFCRHNKDLRLICADGSAQIDAIIVMPVLQPTSVLGQHLMLLGDNSLTTEALTVMLPDVYLHELHQMLILLHKGQVISTSEKEKKAITDLLSLLGLSLDGLIIEEEVPKLPLRPIDQQHQLILSIKAPLAEQDLLDEIKPLMQQKMAFFFMPTSSTAEIKSTWDSTTIKEVDTMCDAQDVKDFFVDPNLISVAAANTSSPASWPSPANSNKSTKQQDFKTSAATEIYAESEEEAIYACDLCHNSEKFNLVAFLKHQKCHANDSPYKCCYPGCKKTFKTLSDFRAHKRVAHKPRLKNSIKCVNGSSSGTSIKANADYYCNQCDKRFKAVGSLKTHMISHMNLPALPANLIKNEPLARPQPPTTGSEVLPESVAKGVFTCRICSTPHVTWREFSKHFQKVHGSVPKILIQYKCVPCDLLFQNKQVYLEHNRRHSHHTQNNQLPLPAVVARAAAVQPPKQTIQPSILAPNLSATAAVDQQPNNSVFNQHLLESSASKILLLTTSNGSKDYPIFKIIRPAAASVASPSSSTSTSSISNASSTTSSSSSSATDKKHVCPICSRGFKRSDNLKAHARTVHYGLKANNCNACGKGYRTKNELLRHQTKACPFRMVHSQDFKLMDFDESLLI